MPIPADVTINRQVLADPSRLTPEVEIWARLKDGTPLVTATKRGNGRLVLFHITANSDWSNLPISGLFVDMLRRLSTMGAIGASGDGASSTTADAAAADAPNILPPIRTLDGAGALKAPPPTAEPIKASALADHRTVAPASARLLRQQRQPARSQRADGKEHACALPGAQRQRAASLL